MTDIQARNVKFFQQHGMKMRCKKDRLFVLEQFSDIGKIWHGQWIDFTDWTLQQVKEWLGY